MPYFWIHMDARTPPPWDEYSGEPIRFRDAVHSVVQQTDGVNPVHTFFDLENGEAYALVEVQAADHEPVKSTLADALPHRETKLLLTPDEAAEQVQAKVRY